MGKIGSCCAIFIGDTMWIGLIGFGAWVWDAFGGKTLSLVGKVVKGLFWGYGNIGLEIRGWNRDVIKVEVAESRALVIVVSYTIYYTKTDSSNLICRDK